MHAADLGGLAPALVVVPTHDPVADHGRRYAERLRAAGSVGEALRIPGRGARVPHPARPRTADRDRPDGDPRIPRAALVG
ncbi:alpha/beta hydrolase fold domain-containing protein [Kitasatospora griseola]|uniref:alpha/beta hydrolase fold domain-containing protein n=1 Tax=Kitasatospora griseola TaxID=2064 RepID=UPI003646B34F